LVVDDNRDAAHALVAVAELLGCETRACYGGAEALAALQEKLPDAILLDLTMPGVGGLEVAARAREIAGRRALLLVAATGLGELEDRTETALAGFHFHLVKPIDSPALQPVLDGLKSVRHTGPWRRRHDWWRGPALG
jgi:CheY-like chemotaxis protein